jgi:hypothetical protein
MSFDIMLVAIVVGGLGLSAAYVRAEYIHWREQGAALRKRESALRELHAERLSEQQTVSPLPSVLQLQEFSTDEAANPDGAASGRRGGTPRTNSLRTYPLFERRKRERQRARQ